MEGNIASAGTVVAAILEQAGYLTQARFMEVFKDFFRDAGALVYFIAAVGGLISVVLFGSFRAARYLLIGPALYWFLVGPTTVVEGVVPKLGGGTPRSYDGTKGIGAAKGGVNEILDKAGEQTKPQIKVSLAFWLFAKPINDFVEEFVDIMLKNEDGSDLAVASKVRGLESIARRLPNQSPTIHLLEEEIIQPCMRSYTLAMSAAENYVKTSITRGVSNKNAAADRSKNSSNYKKYAEQFEDSAKKSKITINTSTTKVLYSLIVANKDATPPILENKDATPPIAAEPGTGSMLLKSLYNQEAKRPIDEILCSVGWNIYFEQIWASARDEQPDLLSLASGEWGEDGQQQACIELTRKLYDDLEGGTGAKADPNAKCELTPGIALALMWNHMSRYDTFQRLLQRHQTYTDPLNARHNSAEAVLTTLLKERSYDQIVAGDGLEIYASQLGVPILSRVVTEVEKMGKDQFQARAEDAPSIAVSLIQGLDQSDQIDLPIYETTRLRQQIFTWASQLPYFQGVMLYIVAVAYPFTALIVLLPGKSAGFLNVPMMWLWIKSWDIGFAAVILLEKIMYNMLPNWSVNPALRTKESWTYEKLPIVLGEGYNFSLMQGVGYHYAVLSMVMLGVPAIMGAITIKGKKAILSNFVQAASGQANDAGQRAASGYSIQASTERALLLQELSGTAKQSVHLGSGGIEGGLKGSAAIAQASMVGMLRTAQIAQQKASDPTQFLSGIPLNLTSFAQGVNKEILERYEKSVTLQANYEKDFRAAFDPMFGRWGVLQMSADAAAAALDGAGARLSGGFETNDAKANAVAEYTKLTSDRLDQLINLSKMMGQIEGQMINEIVKGAGGTVSELAKGEFDKDLLTNGLRGVVGAASIAEFGTGIEERDKALGIGGNFIDEQAAEIILHAVRNTIAQNSEAFGTHLGWARFDGLSTEMYNDPTVRASYERLQAKIDEGGENVGIASYLIAGIYSRGYADFNAQHQLELDRARSIIDDPEFTNGKSIVFDKVYPGGNSFIGSILEQMGGDRRQLTAGDLLHPPVDKDEWSRTTFTLDEVKDGFSIGSARSQQSTLRAGQDSFEGSKVANWLGLGDPETILKAAAIEAERHERENPSPQYLSTLSHSVTEVSNLGVFEPVKMPDVGPVAIEQYEQAAVELYQQARELEKRDKSSKSKYFLDVNLDDTFNTPEKIKESPVAAMESVYSWFNQRENAELAENLYDQSTGKRNLIVEPSDVLYSPVKKGR